MCILFLFYYDCIIRRHHVDKWVGRGGGGKNNMISDGGGVINFKRHVSRFICFLVAMSHMSLYRDQILWIKNVNLLVVCRWMTFNHTHTYTQDTFGSVQWDSVQGRLICVKTEAFDKTRMKRNEKMRKNWKI